jgi:hypothetical protein
VKTYPPYGTSTSERHSFAYLGSTVWGDDVFHSPHPTLQTITVENRAIALIELSMSDIAIYRQVMT